MKWESGPLLFPTRGVRQGDPISPYVFVLCLEKLTHLIAEAVEDGHWQPMRAGRNGPFISHLMFADDLLLFCRATSDNMRHVIQVLECLCSLSRQKISAEKTVLFYSRNVPEELRRELVTF